MLGDDTDLDDTVLANEMAAAMRELADTVTGAPPLRLTPRFSPAPSRYRSPRRLWSRWLAPLAAAAAVITLAITLVTIRSIPNGPVVPPTKPTATSDVVPAYYAELVQQPGGEDNPDQIQVRETLTGHVVATVNPPPGATFAGVAGAADNRTFVVDTHPGAIQSPNGPADQSVLPRTWYLLRLSPGSARPASLTRLAIPPSPLGTGVDGIALSPDGTRLAVAFQTPGRGMTPGGNPAPNGTVSLRVYSVRTGALLRSWSAPPRPDEYVFTPADGQSDSNLSLAWIENGTALAFGELTVKPGLSNDGALPPPQDLMSEAILEQPYSAPSGATLLAAHVAFTFQGETAGKPASLQCGEAATSDLVFAAAGRLICEGTGLSRQPGQIGFGSCAPGTPWYLFGLLEYATSAPTRVLRQYTSNCAGQSAVLPMWTSPSGSTQLVLLNLEDSVTDHRLTFGVFRNGEFTALPMPAALDTAGSFPLSYVAW
jgi:hypothetical protein